MWGALFAVPSFVRASGHTAGATSTVVGQFAVCCGAGAAIVVNGAPIELLSTVSGLG